MVQRVRLVLGATAGLWCQWCQSSGLRLEIWSTASPFSWNLSWNICCSFFMFFFLAPQSLYVDNIYRIDLELDEFAADAFRTLHSQVFMIRPGPMGPVASVGRQWVRQAAQSITVSRKISPNEHQWAAFKTPAIYIYIYIYIYIIVYKNWLIMVD